MVLRVLYILLSTSIVRVDFNHCWCLRRLCMLQQGGWSASLKVLQKARDRLEDFVSGVCQHIYWKDLRVQSLASLAFAMGGCALSFQATCGLVGYLDGIDRSLVVRIDWRITSQPFICCCLRGVHSDVWCLYCKAVYLILLMSALLALICPAIFWVRLPRYLRSTQDLLRWHSRLMKASHSFR